MIIGGRVLPEIPKHGWMENHHFFLIGDTSTRACLFIHCHLVSFIFRQFRVGASGFQANSSRCVRRPQVKSTDPIRSEGGGAQVRNEGVEGDEIFQGRWFPGSLPGDQFFSPVGLGTTIFCSVRVYHHPPPFLIRMVATTSRGFV